MKESKITEKIILKKGGKTLGYAKTTKYKFLDEELIGNTAKIIYRDNLIELVYGEPVYAVVMNNEGLAETSRKQLEVFWKMTRD